MRQPGFMIYADDWATYTEDFSDEELGQMMRALLLYFDTQEEASFSDRGMRQFFRQASKGIELDKRRYEEKCRQNAYVRYKGICKQQHEKPLPYDQWQEKIAQRKQKLREMEAASTGVDERQPTSTDVDERRPTSPIPTPDPTVNNEQSEVKSKESIEKNQKENSLFRTNANSAPAFADGPYRPLSEDEFEKRRERAIASLTSVRQRVYTDLL